MKCKIRITEKDLYQFNLYHVYRSFNGFVSIVFGVLVLVLAFVLRDRLTPLYMVLYIVMGLALLLYNPVNLKMRSQMQMNRSSVLREPLIYDFSDEGILVSTEAAVGEHDGQTMEGSANQALLPWEQVYKVVTHKDTLYIFSSRVNAYILPVAQIDDFDGLKKCITGHLESYRVKF